MMNLSLFTEFHTLMQNIDFHQIVGKKIQAASHFGDKYHHNLNIKQQPSLDPLARIKLLTAGGWLRTNKQKKIT